MSMAEAIIAAHGRKFLRKSAIGLAGGAEVFERVLAGKGYRTALEIGTYRGCSSAEIARHCGRVVTIDLRYGKLERNHTKFDRAAFWNSLGVHNIELHLVEDDTEKAALVGTLDFDFAFIDGAHDATVRNDFAIVERCGKVLFHDYDAGGRVGRNHVYDFVNSLPKGQVQIMGIFALWTA